MDIVERLKISQDFGKDVIGVGDFMKGTSVIQEAIYEIQSLRQQLASLQPTTSASRVEEREAWLNIKQEAEQAKYQILNGLHSSDCSVHNEPAYPNGPCDCILSPRPSVEVLLEALRDLTDMCVTQIGADYNDEIDRRYKKGLAALSSYKPTEG
jgi:hypothetical protein